MIYTIKRFSYLEDEPEQREFNILADIKRSGIKRVAKRAVGRARSKLADKIMVSGLKDRISGTMVANDMMNNPISINNSNKIIKDLTATARKQNACVLKPKGSPDYTFSPNKKTIDSVKGATEGVDISTRNKKKFLKELEKKNRSIILSSGQPDLLSHEIGHLKNPKGNWIERKITSISQNPDTRLEFVQNGSDPMSGKPSVGKAIGNFFKKQAIEIEEGMASKKGLKLLKEAGASKEELKAAKEHLKDAQKTYKHSTSFYKSPLANSINIPSRRGKISRETNRKLWNGEL